MRRITDNWEDELIAFALSSNRKVSQSSLKEYVRYIRTVSERLGVGIADMVIDEDAFQQTVQRIRTFDKWTGKTQGDYVTAINLLWEFRESGSTMPDTNDTHANSLRCEFRIMDQVNAIESKVRENEYSVCKLIFGFLTGYSLALPALAINAGFGMVELMMMFVAVLLSIAGIYLFLPVLMRPARHWREIKNAGENLVKTGRGTLCFNPEEWTRSEIVSCKKTATCVVLSIVLLFATVLVNRLVRG